jgi:hypothetical protein
MDLGGAEDGEENGERCGQNEQTLQARVSPAAYMSGQAVKRPTLMIRS